MTTREFGTEARLRATISTQIAPRVRAAAADAAAAASDSDESGREDFLVIVHCMRSRTRGPYAAHLLAHSPDLPARVQVRVLTGGFQGWWRRFQGRSELFENLAPDGRDAEWRERVLAPEGSRSEAADSRRLRQQQQQQQRQAE